MSKHISGTKEWAEQNANCIDGCSHNCKYCCSKARLINLKVYTPDSWVDEVPHLAKLKQVRKKPSRVMFPSAHDITPDCIEECVTGLKRLLDDGHNLLIVSKPHLECIERLCREFEHVKDRIVFRFTIGSVDDEVLSFWEPNAPAYPERLNCLKYAFAKGFQTSVSCEPMLDDNVEAVVETVAEFVSDSIWIGKMNLGRSRVSSNGAGDKETISRLSELLQMQADYKIHELYARLRDHPKIKWKDSIKKVVGIPLPAKAGMDI